MAMLGKRFQRTISMSQIGPGGSNLHTEKAQAHPSPSPPFAAAAETSPSPKLPSILHDSTQKTNELLLLQAAAVQWEALKARQQDDQHLLHQHQNHHHHHVHQETPASNPWQALMKGIGSGLQKDHVNASNDQPAQSEILKSAEAMMAMVMRQQSSSNHESSGYSFVKGAEECNPQGMASSPVESHLHLGLWPQFPANPSSSPSFSISRAHFLDACFLCKRRLRHERDIFIYRGDTAFCSEECRQRQISSDVRASRRAGSEFGTTP